MTAKSTAYEVRYVVLEERSLFIFAEDRAKAIQEAMLVHENEGLCGAHDVVSSVTCGWNADEVLP